MHLISAPIALAHLLAPPRLRRSPKEWHMLARWATTYGLLGQKGVRWMIQMPRIYNIYHAQHTVANFAEYLRSLSHALWTQWAANSSGKTHF